MKKILTLIVLAGIFACKKEEKLVVSPTAVAIEAPVQHECYAGNIGKDTITMNLELKGNEVTGGKLHYRFF